MMINDPHPDDYRPILHGLIKTILPFEHSRCPSITSDTIESKLYAFFPIDEGEGFLTLQKSLIFFNETALFPRLFTPIIDEEKNALNSEDASTIDSMIAEKQQHDMRLYDSLSAPLKSSAQQFTDLSLDQKRTYLRMWGQSGFHIKRQFYRSLKSIVMITAYSTDELWRTIGYEGPLLVKR